MKELNRKLTSLLIGATLAIGLSSPAALADSHHSSLGGHPQPVTESVIDGDKYSVTKIVVHATPIQVWEVLTDYDNVTKVFPLVKKCQVLKDEGATKVVKHTVTPSGPVGTYSYVLKVQEHAPHLMQWQRMSGAFKQVKGFMKLEPLDNGRTTQVTYAVYVDGGFFMPAPLIRRQSRIDMPGVLTSLKSNSESKVQIAGKP